MTSATTTSPPLLGTRAIATDRYCLCSGASIRFREEGSGPPVVLVHGWTLDLEMWNSQAASLRDSYRVIRFDRRGFGLSSGHPSTDQDCEDLEALCRHMALGRVALVGMSQGARVVMKFAATTQRRVSCVVLDGPPDLDATDAAEFEALRHYRALALAEGISAFRRDWLNHPLMHLRTGDRTAHQTLQSMIARYPGKDLAAAAVTVESSWRPTRLGSFPLPSLIITGEHDLPERIELANGLARRLPRAERAIVPEAGHLPSLDNPLPYNEILRAFLGRHATVAS